MVTDIPTRTQDVKRGEKYTSSDKERTPIWKWVTKDWPENRFFVMDVIGVGSFSGKKYGGKSQLSQQYYPPCLYFFFSETAAEYSLFLASLEEQLYFSVTAYSSKGIRSRCWAPSGRCLLITSPFPCGVHLGYPAPAYLRKAWRHSQSLPDRMVKARKPHDCC